MLKAVILFIKVDVDKAGQNMINNSNNKYAKANNYFSHLGKDKSKT